MVAKPFDFREVDNSVRCKVCGKPLKKNVIARKLKRPEKCYKHYMVAFRAKQNANRR